MFDIQIVKYNIYGEPLFIRAFPVSSFIIIDAWTNGNGFSSKVVDFDLNFTDSWQNYSIGVSNVWPRSEWS